jgi:TRAP-type C4-dicarboxylate transport system permease small subunit
MLEKLNEFNRMVSGWAQWIGFGALFLMLALTCVDVIGTKLFRLPVYGSLDLMMLAQLIAISFTGAMALIQDRHVQVEFIINRLPKRIQALVDSVVQLLCLGLFMVVVWRLFAHGYHLQVGGEETATARIPMSPFSYACSLAIIPLCLVLLQRFLNSILKVVKNDS